MLVFFLPVGIILFIVPIAIGCPQPLLALRRVVTLMGATLRLSSPVFLVALPSEVPSWYNEALGFRLGIADLCIRLALSDAHQFMFLFLLCS